MEEKKKTQIEKQEEGATQKEATRMTVQRKKKIPRSNKGRTAQGRKRKLKTRERGPLGQPLEFFFKGRPMEERKRRQTDK